VRLSPQRTATAESGFAAGQAVAGMGGRVGCRAGMGDAAVGDIPPLSVSPVFTNQKQGRGKRRPHHVVGALDGLPERAYRDDNTFQRWLIQK
jgi:hypothetical protein